MVSLGWSNLRCKGSLSCRSLNKRKSLSQSGCNPHFQPIWNFQQLTSNQIQSKFLFQPSTRFIAVDNYTFSTQIGHQGSKPSSKFKHTPIARSHKVYVEHLTQFSTFIQSGPTIHLLPGVHQLLNASQTVRRRHFYVITSHQWSQDPSGLQQDNAPTRQE